jgi:hypothetical protein
MLLQDICNCYMSLCSTDEQLKDYEEKLLEKCCEKEFDLNLINTMYTAEYEPPPFSLP